MSTFLDTLPQWLLEGMRHLAVPAEIVLIFLIARFLRRLLLRLTSQVVATYNLPIQLHVGAKRIIGFVVMAAAALLILERLGVSATVLWTAFTGFATVAAVGFFAAWSVLSNIFCTVLIFTTGLFRLQDVIEVIDGADKPGLRGRVIDINLVYTTLEEPDAPGQPILKVPNSLFFQRSVRRWRQPAEVAATLMVRPAAAATAAADAGGPPAENRKPA